MDAIKMIEKIMRVIFEKEEDLQRIKSYLLLYTYGDVKASERPVLVLSSPERGVGKNLVTDYILDALGDSPIMMNDTSRYIENWFPKKCIVYTGKKLDNVLAVSSKNYVNINTSLRETYKEVNEAFLIINTTGLSESDRLENSNLLVFELGRSKVEEFTEIDKEIWDFGKYGIHGIHGIAELIEKHTEEYVNNLLLEQIKL